MKNFVLVLIGLTACASVFAGEVDQRDLARILINNPVKSIKNFPPCNDLLVSATSTEVNAGVVSYVLTWAPGGMCPNQKAIVTIIEDSNPMAYDGARIYTTKLEVSKF